MVNKVTDFINNNKALFVGVKLALVALGVILLCCGIIPLGLGLLVAGGASLAEPMEAAWDAIVTKVKEVFENIKSYWNNNIAKYFTADWWEKLGKKALNGLITAVESGLNKLTSGLRSFLNGVVSGINAVSDALGINLSVPTIPAITIPRLAQGAVIPPNRPFAAILGDQKSGTNIEAPLETIVEALNIALDSRNAGYNNMGSQTVILEIDGREFGRAVVEQGNRETRRVGTKLVVV